MIDCYSQQPGRPRPALVSPENRLGDLKTSFATVGSFVHLVCAFQELQYQFRHQPFVSRFDLHNTLGAFTHTFTALCGYRDRNVLSTISPQCLNLLPNLGFLPRRQVADRHARGRIASSFPVRWLQGVGSGQYASVRNVSPSGSRRGFGTGEFDDPEVVHGSLQNRSRELGRVGCRWRPESRQRDIENCMISFQRLAMEAYRALE